MGEYWDNSGTSGVKYVIEAGKALLTGTRPEIDRDPKGQLDGIFGVAARRGVGLDIHLHEPGEMGFFNVQETIGRTIRFFPQDDQDR